MIKIIKIEGISNTYPEEIEGTHEWYSAQVGGVLYDLFEAQEIFQKDGFFKGVINHLIHFPDGKVHSPFQLKENVYVDKPIWNDGEFHFLVIQFDKNLIQITKYIPEEEKLQLMTEFPLSEVEDCYNLKLKTTPLHLGRSSFDGYYEIVWPEKKKIALGETETVLFRDGDRLYLSAWKEEPDYQEYVIVRDIQTGKILEKSKGYIQRLPNNVCWKI